MVQKDCKFVAPQARDVKVSPYTRTVSVTAKHFSNGLPNNQPLDPQSGCPCCSLIILNPNQDGIKENREQLLHCDASYF